MPSLVRHPTDTRAATAEDSVTAEFHAAPSGSVSFIGVISTVTVPWSAIVAVAGAGSTTTDAPEAPLAPVSASTTVSPWSRMSSSSAESTICALFLPWATATSPVSAR